MYVHKPLVPIHGDRRLPVVLLALNAVHPRVQIQRVVVALRDTKPGRPYVNLAPDHLASVVRERLGLGKAYLAEPGLRRVVYWGLWGVPIATGTDYLELGICSFGKACDETYVLELDDRFIDHLSEKCLHFLNWLLKGILL